MSDGMPLGAEFTLKKAISNNGVARAANIPRHWKILKAARLRLLIWFLKRRSCQVAWHFVRI
jgi:hypothetical protein